MNKPLAAITTAIALIAAALLMIGASATVADRGGCPNEASSNGATHADDHSAHGSAKSDARGCSDPAPQPTVAATPTPEPVTPDSTTTPTSTSTPTDTPTRTPTDTPTATPTPTPTATPTPTVTPTGFADVAVVSTSVSSPTSAVAGAPFQVSAAVIIRDYGPTATVLVDTTFLPAMPADCTASTGAVTIESWPLSMGSNSFLSRTWSVTCSQGGPHIFAFAFNVAIDPSEPVVDPLPANNTGTGSHSTQVN